jgi:dinuclear metal center YbgI/SA1388 family protein
MPVGIDEFVSIVEAIAPRELAYDWDNSGLLLRCSDTVSRVLIALDATMPVAEEAEREGCDMILVHHPLIFSPMKSLSCHKPQDAVLMKLIRAGISLYAAHTTFDRAKGGINDVLADNLGLCDVKAIPDAGESLMRVGDLPEALEKDAFLTHVKGALSIESLRASQTQCKKISRVAVLGGSGGDFVAEAKKEGAQALVTGEAKHHHFIEAIADGILLIEAGHYDTEYAFVDAIYMSLQSRLNEVQLHLGLKKAENEKAPYVFK